jgi:type I restriction enzyme S subunit
MNKNKLKLEKICTFFNGRIKPNSKGKIPVYGGNGIISYTDQYNADNILVIGRVGAYCGNAFYSRNKCWVSDNAIGIILNENVSNIKYIFYFLGKMNIRNLAIGSSQPLITQDILKNIEIDLPSLEEQKRIADILTALDDKIELNNQMNQTLEEIASLFYKRWFVDFEFPDDKGKPYKSSGGEMVDSELGMIPKGWEVKNLTEIAKFVNGLAMQKFRPQINEESLPVLKIKELISNSVSKSTERCKKNIKDEVKVFDGDIIFSWSGTLAVKIWSGGDAGLNQHLFKVSSSIYPKWLYYLIVLYNLNNFKSIASDKATTMGHINRSHLEKTYFTIPQIKIINKEYTYMKTIIDKIIENKVSIKYLQETKEKVISNLI